MYFKYINIPVLPFNTLPIYPSFFGLLWFLSSLGIRQNPTFFLVYLQEEYIYSRLHNPSRYFSWSFFSL